MARHAEVRAKESRLSDRCDRDFRTTAGGVITAGLDNACGIAAFTLMPKGADIPTVEFKTNLLAPAKGERFIFRAHVVKPGRTLTVCEARGFAEADGTESLVATMTGTLMALTPRN